MAEPETQHAPENAPAVPERPEDAEPGTGAPPRRLIVVAAVLALVLAAGVAVTGVVVGGGAGEQPDAVGPLPLVPVPAPQAGSPACANLLGAVPAELVSSGSTLAHRPLADPAPPATRAWGEQSPVVLRCGLDRPPELTRTAQLRQVNGVRWLQVPGEGSATWYVVDREVYAALTVPDDAGTGPLQAISDSVTAVLPPRPPRF